MGPKIQVMKEGVFFVADVDKSGIEARHQLLDLSHVYVPDGVGQVPALFLQGDQAAILQEGYGDLLGLYVDDEFAFHSFIKGDLWENGRRGGEELEGAKTREQTFSRRKPSEGVGAVGKSLFLVVIASPFPGCLSRFSAA